MGKVECNKNTEPLRYLSPPNPFPPKHMKEHWTEVLILKVNMSNTEQLGVYPSST